MTNNYFVNKIICKLYRRFRKVFQLIFGWQIDPGFLEGYLDFVKFVQDNPLAILGTEGDAD